MMETKHYALAEVELKFDGSDGYQFTGYASKFNGVDSYGDTILPGAYRKTIKKRERPIRMRWNHYGNVIGKWLEIREDDIGLKVHGELTRGHSVAEDARASMAHGAVDGLSIGFRPVQIRDLGDGRRELKEIELIEISIVEEPADLGARISDIKSAIEAANTIREIETVLRDAAGLSRAVAGALVSKIKALGCGDRGAELTAEEIRRVFQQKIAG
jgi:HK97 family phage prohead protease